MAAKKKYTVGVVKQLVEELLSLKPMADRYKELEAQVKEGMQVIKWNEVESDKGRVFISESERVTVTPATAREVLGTEFAAKLIQVKESVPNNLIKAFVEVGEISDEDRDKLLEMAQRAQVISLHVRPLA
jgi:tRNA(Met) C34 N-acetyltransferase TmcA